MTLTKAHAETAAEAALHERPPAPISKSDARAHRPSIVGPDVPEEPFPIILSGSVQRGFGRGGKDLGCPTGTSSALCLIVIQPFTRSMFNQSTANLPDDSLPPMSSVTQTGVYYGFAQVTPSSDGQNTPLSSQDTLVYPMVMSLGWNPFYKNKQLTAVSQLRTISSAGGLADVLHAGDSCYARLSERFLWSRAEGYCSWIHSPRTRLRFER